MPGFRELDDLDHLLIDRLLAGDTLTEAARASGCDPKTAYRRRHYNAGFQVALLCGRAEELAPAIRGLSGLVPLAVTVLQRVLQAADADPATPMLKLKVSAAQTVLDLAITLNEKRAAAELRAGVAGAATEAAP
jgi:hypothetical protein